jgi:hypothetical protein
VYWKILEIGIPSLRVTPTSELVEGDEDEGETFSISLFEDWDDRQSRERHQSLILGSCEGELVDGDEIPRITQIDEIWNVT